MVWNLFCFIYIQSPNRITTGEMSKPRRWKSNHWSHTRTNPDPPHHGHHHDNSNQGNHSGNNYHRSHFRPNCSSSDSHHHDYHHDNSKHRNQSSNRNRRHNANRWNDSRRTEEGHFRQNREFQTFSQNQDNKQTDRPDSTRGTLTKSQHVSSTSGAHSSLCQSGSLPGSQSGESSSSQPKVKHILLLCSWKLSVCKGLIDFEF